MPILECRALTKIYGGSSVQVKALDHVSLTISEGEFCAVTGPSGSGKSTLLHLLGALEKPTEGGVFFQGHSLSAYHDSQLSVLRRRRFGFVFQAYNLVQELTAYENMLLPVMLDAAKPDRLDHLPGALSGGQQQRVAIARALANKPAILFADEPTGNLDGRSGREVLALLKQMSAGLGITLVLVTHDLNIAEQADRIVRLSDGRLRPDGQP